MWSNSLTVVLHLLAYLSVGEAYRPWDFWKSSDRAMSMLQPERLKAQEGLAMDDRGDDLKLSGKTTRLGQTNAGAESTVNTSAVAPKQLSRSAKSAAVAIDDPLSDDTEELQKRNTYWRDIAWARRFGPKQEVPYQHPMEALVSFFGQVIPLDWGIFFVVVFLMALLQALLLYSPSTPSLHTTGLVLWLAVGGAYSAKIFYLEDKEQGEMWLMGYFIEVVLSVENIFVYHWIVNIFKVPREQTRKALLVVILCQVLFEMILYMGLAGWIRRLKVLPYLLGMWLIYGAWHLCIETTVQFEEMNYMDTWTVGWMRKCLGDRFWPAYDDHGRVFTHAKGETAVTLLGVVIGCLLLVDFCMESDVVLTKIEELPNQHIAFTSSAIATFAMPDLFFLTGDLFTHVLALKYSIGLILVFLGGQMLLNEVLTIPAIVSCGVIASVLVMTVVISFCIDWFRGTGHFWPSPAETLAGGSGSIGGILGDGDGFRGSRGESGGLGGSGDSSGDDACRSSRGRSGDGFKMRGSTGSATPPTDSGEVAVGAP